MKGPWSLLATATVAHDGDVTQDFDTPLLEPSDVARMKTFALAVIGSMVVIAAVVAGLLYLLQPDWGAAGAVGAGIFVGFWMAPLAGGVIGNGLHEKRLGELEAQNDPESEGHPLHAAA